MRMYSRLFFDVFAKTQAEKNSSSKKTQAFLLQNSSILHQNSMHRRLFCKILSKHYCCFLENWKKQQNGQVFWSKFTFFLVNWEIYLKKLKISLKTRQILKNSSKSEKNSRIFFKNSVNRRLRASVSLHKMSKKKPGL